jgi:hypothetical protein
MAYIGNIPAEKYTNLAVQHFSVSATTGYTLTHSVTNENGIALFINNVRQEPGGSYAYTAAGTTLTLSAATAGTDTMYCVYLGKSVGTISPPDGSVNSAKIVDGSIIDGDINASAAIAQSKLVDIVNADIDASAAIAQSKLVDVVNADIDAGAAIATSKLSGAVTSIPSHGLGALASLATVGTTQIDNDSVTGAKLNPALVAGDVIYADGTDTINRLAKPATPANEVLTFATSATAPSWVAPAGGGKLLAVVQSTKTDTASSTASTPTSTGLEVTTGTLTTGSKVLIQVTVNVSNSTTDQRTHITLWNGATQLFLGDTASPHRTSAWMRSHDSYHIYNLTFMYLHDVGSTSAQTYTVKYHRSTNTSYTNWLNRSSGEDANSGRSASSITAMEIGA